MSLRLNGRDELRLTSWYQAVECYGGRTLLRSSFGAMVDAIEQGRIGIRTFATSDSAHDSQIALLSTAKELASIETSLRAIGARHRQILTVAYCGRRLPELESRFDVLAGVVMLTKEVRIWYREDEQRKRCHGDRVGRWLVRKLPMGKVLTSALSERVEKIRSEADILLSRAVEAWEQTNPKRRSGGRSQVLRRCLASAGKPYISGLKEES